jgi:hypothetical protein
MSNDNAIQSLDRTKRRRSCPIHNLHTHPPTQRNNTAPRSPWIWTRLLAISHVSSLSLRSNRRILMLISIFIWWCGVCFYIRRQMYAMSEMGHWDYSRHNDDAVPALWFRHHPATRLRHIHKFESNNDRKTLFCIKEFPTPKVATNKAENVILRYRRSLTLPKWMKGRVRESLP